MDILLLLLALWVGGTRASVPTAAPLDSVVPNDNRVAGGQMRGNVRELRLVARRARWRPDLGVDSMATVQVFAEEGRTPTIPGPLLRATTGTELHVSVRNDMPDSVLVVHGLRGGTFTDDTLHVRPGDTRELRFRAGTPGTYLYWGTTTASAIDDRSWRDSQLTGAIVIDPAGTKPDSAERIFVLTVLDVYPEDSVHNKAHEDIWELAINGRSWPHDERIRNTVGDTTRWRWINGSYLPHPMHLHGFHFEVLSKGNGNADSTYAPADRRLGNTELMLPGTTFRMQWVPTRAGNWLMHCHMTPHITPFPERPDSIRVHDAHDVRQHPFEAMAGLVLGITTVDRRPTVAMPTVRHRVRVFAQQAHADSGKVARRGYVVQRADEPSPDSVDVPGAPIVLTRGETSAITVINRTDHSTTVHWHGMELESVYDGVSGWSRTGSSVAPMIAPGDSFTVLITPPRAGTYIYHTHMDEGPELGAGMYGPLVVVEPGQRFDVSRDLTFIVANAVVGDSIGAALNGRREPAPLDLRVGVPYRLRFINIHSAGAARVDLRGDDDQPLTWRRLAKDGADLPVAKQRTVPSWFSLFGVGETYDFQWTPSKPMTAMIEVKIEGDTLRQSVRVRP